MKIGNFNFADHMFKKVDGVVWDMMSGQLGILKEDSGGIVSICLGEIECGEAVDAQISLNVFEGMSFPIPAFAQSTPLANVQVGDLIYSSSNKGWVIKVPHGSSKTFQIMKTDGTCVRWVPPKTQILGFDSGIMVVKSLISMLPGGQNQLGDMKVMLMPLLASKLLGDTGDSNSGAIMNLEEFLPVMLMSQMAGGDNSNQGMSMMMNLFMLKGMAKGF